VTGRVNRWHGRAIDAAIAALLCAVAIAIRLPAVHDIPRYTDETGEVQVALAIAFEGARPLVHNDAYRGPLWAYLLAGTLAAFGPRPELPRLFALAMGALAVGATFALGRVASGRAAGIVAALCMATAVGPVALGSHIAWSNHATPLWTTLAAVALCLGGRDPAAGRGADRWLALSGPLWGFALHTHPSVVALLPGAVIWFLATADRRRRLRTPAPWLAMGLFVATLSPLVAYNVRHDLASIDEAVKPSQPVARDHSPAALAANAAGLLAQLGRAAGAGVPAEPGDPVPGPLVKWTDGLRPAATIAYALVIVAALAWSARHGPRLAAALAVPALLILPLVNRSSANFYDTRYVFMLLPLGYVALGAAAAPALADRRGSRRARGTRVAAVILTAAVTLYPLATTGAYYARETAAGRTNAPFHAVADLLAAEASAPGHHVLVDKAMRPIKLGGGGDPTRAFDQLLALRGVPHTVSDLDEMRWYLTNSLDTTYWMILATETAQQLEAEFGDGLEPRALGGEGWVVRVRRRVP